jgi:two-component system, OmpR family, heavy metal sensor histidine kinase CusS
MNSTRLRIALLSAGISGLVLAAFGSLMWLVVSEMRVEAVDREIRTFASRHPGLFSNRGRHDRLASSLEFTFGADYTNSVILLMTDSSGNILYASPNWPEELPPQTLSLRLEDDKSNNNTNLTPPLAGHGAEFRRGRGFGLRRGGPPPVIFTKAAKFFTARGGDTSWRVGLLGNEEVSLALGLNYDQVQGELDYLRDAFLLTLPVALFLVGLGGWVVSGRALRPLRVIAETAERVTARGLNQRIPQSNEDPEAARVVQVLNRMMDRLEASFRQATRFSADASHELKTPIAVMQGELENALQAAAPGSAQQQLFSNLLEETQRLKIITRGLLLLAQADAGQLRLTLEPVDLSAELSDIIEDARVLAADLRLGFDLAIPPHLCVHADRGMVRTAVTNLLANAVKHNEPDGKVTLTLAAIGNHAVMAICNTGPGIPKEDQSRIFERFYRAGRASRHNAEGIGLGLSLAREIVRAHGGDLTLKESCEGQTCFELRLNLQRQD